MSISRNYRIKRISLDLYWLPYERCIYLILILIIFRNKISRCTIKNAFSFNAVNTKSLQSRKLDKMM